jgi:hypothetical protein
LKPKPQKRATGSRSAPEALTGLFENGKIKTMKKIKQKKPIKMTRAERRQRAMKMYRRWERKEEARRKLAVSTEGKKKRKGRSKLTK